MEYLRQTAFKNFLKTIHLKLDIELGFLDTPGFYLERHSGRISSYRVSILLMRT